MHRLWAGIIDSGLLSSCDIGTAVLYKSCRSVVSLVNIGSMTAIPCSSVYRTHTATHTCHISWPISVQFGTAELHAISFNKDEFVTIGTVTGTLYVPAQMIFCPHFVHCSCDLYRIRYASCLQTLLSWKSTHWKLNFNWERKRISVRSVHIYCPFCPHLLSVLSTFTVRSGTI